MTGEEYKSEYEQAKYTPWQLKRANYGMPFGRIVEKIDRVITAPRCTS